MRLSITRLRSWPGNSAISPSITARAGSSGVCRPKTAIKMFPFVSETTQHSVTDIIQLCEANKEKGKLYQGVLDNKDKLDVFWKVMQLEDVQLSVDGITTIKESLGQKPTFKPFQLRLLFLQDNAFKQINQFQFWNRILMPLNQASNLVETTEEKGE